jgi:anti-sigma regulatory factor (Ser/Thr protein kinase)
VGGDFYDLFELEDGRVAFVLADVSGKGMSAALFMSMFMTLLHEKLIKEADPAQALNEANDSVARSNPENMFVTILAAVFDPTTNVLTFANAGHMPPLVVGKGYLDPDPGIALGLFEDADIKNESRVLMPGEGIVLYTDGVTDANDTEKQFFGGERLAQAVATSGGAKEAVETIVATVDGFTGDAEQFDDLTLMSLFAKKSDKGTWKVSLKPEIGSFEVVGSYLKELCSDNDAVLKRVMLACDEGFANVVYYSEASAVEFAIECAGSWLVVRMSDDGVPFDPLSYDAKEREFEDLEFGGMGISFIKQSCDEVSYSYENDKNVLEMRFSL